MKKNMTKRLFFGLTVLITALAVIFSACPNDTTTTTVAAPPSGNQGNTITKIPVTGVELTRTTPVKMRQGSAVVLTAKVLPGDTTESKAVTWSSNDETIAKVSGGKVTGVKVGGPVTITVTTVEGGFTASIEVTVVDQNDNSPGVEGVVDIPVKGITLKTKTLTIEVDDTGKLEWEFDPADAINKAVTFSYDTSKIEIKAPAKDAVDTIVKGNAVGTVTVTITADDTDEGVFYDTCVITVNPASEEYNGDGHNPEVPDINIEDNTGGDVSDPNNPDGSATLKDDDLTLSVTIDGDATIVSYQWYQAYSATSYTPTFRIPASNGGDKPTFDAPTNVVGTFYYFLEVTYSNGKKQVSSIRKVTVLPNGNDDNGGGGDNGGGNSGGGNGGGNSGGGNGENSERPTINAVQPTITVHPVSSTTYSQYQSIGVVALTAKANKLKPSGDPDHGVLSYQWYKNTTDSYTGPGLETLTGYSGRIDDLETPELLASCTPTTAEFGTFYYYCVFANEIPATSETGFTRRTNRSNIAKVIVKKVISAEVPSFKNNPAVTGGGTVPVPNREAKLSLEVNPVTDGGNLTYQWYFIGKDGKEKAINAANVAAEKASYGGTGKTINLEGGSGAVPANGIVEYVANTSTRYDVTYYYCTVINELSAPPEGTVFADGGQRSPKKTNTVFVGVGVTISIIAYDPTGARGIKVDTRDYNGGTRVKISGNLGVVPNGDQNPDTKGIRFGMDETVQLKGWKRTNTTITDPLNTNYWVGYIEGEIDSARVGEWRVTINTDKDPNDTNAMYLDGSGSGAHVIMLPDLKGIINKAPGVNVTRPTTVAVDKKGKNVTLSEASVRTNAGATGTLADLWQYHDVQQTVVEYSMSTVELTGDVDGYDSRIEGNKTVNVNGQQVAKGWSSELTSEGKPKITGFPAPGTRYYIYARSAESANFKAGKAFLSWDGDSQSNGVGNTDSIVTDVGAEILSMPTEREKTDGTITINKNGTITTSRGYFKPTGQTIEYYITETAGFTTAQADALTADKWQDWKEITKDGDPCILFGYKEGSWGTLTCYKAHYIFARAKENDNFHAGKSEKSAAISTLNPFVYFTTNSVNNLRSKEVNFGGKLLITDNAIIPLKGGYTFEGWYKDPEGIQPWNYNDSITASLRLYGMWIDNEDTKQNDDTTTTKPANKRYGTMLYVKGSWFNMGTLSSAAAYNVSPTTVSNYNQAMTVTGEPGYNDNEKNQKAVGITGFWMSEKEVTQDSYNRVMGEGVVGFIPPSGFTTSPEGNAADLPVESVNWYQAIAYCNKRSEKEGLRPAYKVSNRTDISTWGQGEIPGKDINNLTWNGVTIDPTANGYRLPTEAQWEFVCRAGGAATTATAPLPYAQNVRYTWAAYYETTGYYNNKLNLDYAWASNNSNNKTHEVGKKTKNALGFYDMNGNVAEWVWDFSPLTILPYNNSLYTTAYNDGRANASVNPDGLKYSQKPSSTAADTTGYSYHIVRGGSWNSSGDAGTPGNGATVQQVPTLIDNMRTYQPMRVAARGLSAASTATNSAVNALHPGSKQNTVGFRVMRPMERQIEDSNGNIINVLVRVENR